MHECILVISLLLEMNILVMVIILMCLACMPERNPGKPQPWVGVSLSPVSVGTVISGMAWQGIMSVDLLVEIILLHMSCRKLISLLSRP